MKPYSKFSLPDWLFKPRKSMDYTSSTVAAFSPEEGIKSEDGFKGSMLPGPDAAQLDKMTLLINDPTLRYEKAEDAVRTAHAIHRLIQAGFQIYIIHDGKPVLLHNTADLSEGDHLDAEKAASILVNDIKIPRDDIQVCNFGKIEELRSRLYEEKYWREARIRDSVLDLWSTTKAVPHGQDFPPIQISDFDIKSEGHGLAEALELSDIEYKVMDCFRTDNVYMSKYHLKTHSIQLIDNHTLNNQSHVRMKNELEHRGNIKYLTLTHLELKNDATIIPANNVIQNLSITGGNITTGFLRTNLAHMHQLKHLYIQMVTIQDNAEITLPERLETLQLIATELKYIKLFLKHESNVKYLSICPSEETTLSGIALTNKFPKLQQLSLQYFRIDEESLFEAMNTAVALELNNCYFMDGKQPERPARRMSKVTRLFILGTRNDPNDNMGMIHQLLEGMDSLEELQISNIMTNKQFELKLDKKVSFSNTLKVLNLYETDFDHETFFHMVQPAIHLKSVNIGVDFAKYHLGIGNYKSKRFVSLHTAFTEHDENFEEMEELYLDGLTIHIDHLMQVLQKMPKLRILSLKESAIHGETDKYLSPNPIIDLNLEGAVVFASHQEALIEPLTINSSPISLKLGKLTGAKISYAGPLSEIKYTDNNCNTLINLDISGGINENPQLYLLRSPNIRKFNISETYGLPMSCSASQYFYLTELDLRGRFLVPNELFNILDQTPHLKSLEIDDKYINAELLNYFASSRMLYKNNFYLIYKHMLEDRISKKPRDAEYERITTSEQAHIASTRRMISTLDKSMLPPTDIIRGTKIEGEVYDCMADHSNESASLNNPQATPSYQLTPMFKHLSGPDLQLESARLYAYSPDFRTNHQAVVRTPIVCKPEHYTIRLSAQDYPSVYERTAYDAAFHDAKPLLGLSHPWIRLHSLTANDELLALHTSMNRSEYDLYFSEPDGFYYLMLKPGAARPVSVTLKYQIAAFKPSCAALPESCQAQRRPFFQEYTSPAPAEFARKNIHDKLADIIAHPEHHACGVRADAFLSSIENDSAIEGYRGVGSGLHGWAEVKFGGVWHTVDVGGAPADMEFLPEAPKPSTDAMQALIPASPVNLASQNDVNIVTPTAVHRVDPKLTLQKSLNQSTEHTNILVICRKDARRDHLKSVRRYLLSLSPETSTVVDTYDNALSSAPYIALNKETQTWMPVDPVGADGWLAHRMPQTERLIIDWSSLSDNQSTKMNSAIDLNDRQIDGVAIKPGVKVISLICEDDHRLKDSSFLSRHSGHIINLTGAYLHPEPTAVVSDEFKMTVEVYNSPQWQKLLLGSLGFDDNGKPTHANQALLASDKPLHIIINNPPEQCEAFERFIHDLQDGHDFKYCDQSIRLPRMQVSLTHGYDFAILKDAVQSLNIDVTADQLQSIEIDHVLTPSTFERCLETRKIVDGKLTTSPGWLYSANSEQPLSLYITRTLSKQQYCYLLKTAQKQSLHLYCAPGVVLPKELEEIPRREYTSAPFYKGGENSQGRESLFDVSELTADDILYRFKYKHDKENKRFTYSEKISDIWKKLEKGEDVILTGVFSDELMDHLATLLLPKPYLWHDGQKKTFKGKLILEPDNLDIKCRGATKVRPEPKLVSTEEQRKPALMAALKDNPAVFIEGKPGIGKSCFIREIKADTTLNCYSFDDFNKNTLQEWAASNEDKPAILFIDEATIRGTDWSIFKFLYAPKRGILIDGQIYPLTENHKVVFIGNRVKQMPALLRNEPIPTLQFDTLTRVYVINTILVPIFAEVDKDSALQMASSHYNTHKSVREMQGEAIRICASAMNQSRGGLTPQAYPPSCEAPTRSTYHLTVNRQPIFDAIIDSLHARQFMQQASADSAKYGGQTGHMLQGLPRLGKSDIIHAAMLSAHYGEVTNLNELHEAARDHRFRYYRIPSSCKIHNLRKHLRKAFDQGCIVHIDELDALLKPDTPADIGEVSRLVAELNAYLMGEDLQHGRPKVPGFMLLATGNGITHHGRAALPDSLKSRLHQHAVKPYTQDECEWIIAQKYPGLNASCSITRFVNDPKGYTFSDLMADCKNARGNVDPGSAGLRPLAGKTHTAVPIPETPITHTAAPIIYHFYNTRAFKITMPGVLVGVSLGLSLTYTAAYNSIPIIAGLAMAGAMTAAIIAACYTHHQQSPTSQSASLIALV